MSENTANIVALIGATGQGKSATFKHWLRQSPPARCILVDAMDEYGEHAEKVATLEELARAVQAPKFAVRYVPKGDQAKRWERYDVLCRIAYDVGNLTFGVEELNLYTNAGGGGAGWSDVTLRGRHRGLVVVGLSQRPAIVDKNFFSNATRVRCFRLNYAPDVATMAGVLGVDQERVQQLAPLNYIERDMATGQVSDGVVTFGAAPAEKSTEPTPPPQKKPAAKRRKKRR